MKIKFIGDVHGQWRALQEEIDRSTADLFIQVGDMGLYDPHNDIPTFDTHGATFLFIDGNHDNVKALIERKFWLPPYVRYVERARMITISNRNFLFMGGGEGTPHWKKIEGKDYWPNLEVPSEEERNEFLAKAYDAQYIITHAGPAQSTATRNERDSELVQFYADVLSDPKVNPEIWFFGHHHPPKTHVTKYRSTYLYCLPPLVRTTF